MFVPHEVTEKSSLGNKQRLFMWCIGKLITYAYTNDWALTAGDFSRMDRRGHMEGSCHYSRLAADVNVFADFGDGHWEYLDSYEEAINVWDSLGKFWKELHPLCRWGGDFAGRDLNHFSITIWGKS